MNKEFSYGAVIYKKIDEHTLFLLVYSNRNKTWGFPKGHIEPDETTENAALREIKEETGLTQLRIIDGFRQENIYSTLSNRGQYKGQPIEKHSIYFLCETAQTSIVVDQHEISDYRWVELEEAESFLTFESLRVILRNAKQFLSALKSL